MPLVDDLLAVDRGGLGPGCELGRVEAQAHRPALVLHVPLVRHEVDDRMLGEHVELGRIGVLRADHVPRELDDRALQAQAQTQVRDAPLTRVVGGQDLAFDAAMAEAARDEHAGDTRQSICDVLRGERFRVDPADPGVHAVGPCRMPECLGNAEVRVRQLDVLADEADLQGRLGRLDPVDQRAPARQIGLDVLVAETQLADDQAAQPERLELERDLVDRVRRLGRDDRLAGDVREQGDLLADLVADRMVGAQHDDVRLDADAAQLLD